MRCALQERKGEAKSAAVTGSAAGAFTSQEDGEIAEPEHSAT